MKTSLRQRIGILALTCVAIACDQKVQTREVYMRWVNDPDNGLVTSRTANGIVVTVRYLPGDLLALNELKGMQTASQVQKDSIRNSYDNSLTFLVTFSPDKDRGARGDVALRDFSGYDAYARRSVQMNFDMASRFVLKSDSAERTPVLTNMENTYGLSEDRNIVVVFNADPKKNRDLDKSRYWEIVYTDEFFDLGINHFVFSKKKIDNLPRLKL